MDQTLLYGFILDSSAGTKAKSDINNNYNQGVGVLIGEPANYIVNKAYLTDTRSTRLEYTNNTKLDGKLEIIYDANKLMTLLKISYLQMKYFQDMLLIHIHIVQNRHRLMC